MSSQPTGAGGARRLLLLGSNRSNLLSVRAARSAGFFTIVADPHADSPGLREADLAWTVDVRDGNALLELIRGVGGVNGIVSMSEVGIESAAAMSAQLGLAAIAEAAAANARSKAAMRRLWQDSGFSVEFAVVRSENAAFEAADRLGMPLIVKPDRSFGGSRGVSRVEAREAIPEAFALALESGLPGSSVVMEQCIAGSEHSCEVLINEGIPTVLCIGEKVKSPAPYRVDMSVQYPAALSPQQEEEVGGMCRSAVRALGLARGAAHVEFAYTAAGPRLFEIGARCGGGHTPQLALAVSGVDEFLEVCRMACGEQFRPPAEILRRGGDYRFVIFPPGRVRAVDVPREIGDHPDVLDVAVTVQPGEEIRSVQSTSNRAGFVVTRGSDRAAAVELANWACSRISVTYADGSTAHAMPLEEFEVKA